MISFQRLLGREQEFAALLEASAQEACHAVSALKHILTHRDEKPNLDDFAKARRQDKKITEEISHRLITTFVTPMEREDIEALAESLYKIPKTVEKFAERYLIVADKVRDIDFTRQIELLDEAANIVLEMVKNIGNERDLSRIKTLLSKLQDIEAQADDVIQQYLQKLYAPGFPALKAIMLKDLFELNEKAVDRCRDAGNVLSHVLLKNS